MDQKTFQTEILNNVSASYVDGLLARMETERKSMLKALVSDRGQSTKADPIFLFVMAAANNYGSISVGEMKELNKLHAEFTSDLHDWLTETNRLVSLLTNLKSRGKEMGKLRDFTNYLTS